MVEVGGFPLGTGHAFQGLAFVFVDILQSIMRVAAFTPLPAVWPHELVTIARSIRVIERPSFDEQTWSFWNLRRTEETEGLERRHWFCVDEECEWHERGVVGDRLTLLLRNAMLGYQLWVPKGWDGIIICADCETMRVENVTLAESYVISKWGNMMTPEKGDPAALAVLVEGTVAALESGFIPVVNPFQFLEIGLQTAFNHVLGGTLFLTFGLDGLMGGAGGEDVFSKRLARFLGGDTFIFPEDYVGRRPTYTVGEMSEKIFGLRNQLAHGQQVLEKFRKPITFTFDPAELSYLSVENWNGTRLIFESALFILIAGLRKVIMTPGLLERLKDYRTWTRWLDSPA